MNEAVMYRVFIPVAKFERWTIRWNISSEVSMLNPIYNSICPSHIPSVKHSDLEPYCHSQIIIFEIMGEFQVIIIFLRCRTTCFTDVRNSYYPNRTSSFGITLPKFKFINYVLRYTFEKEAGGFTLHNTVLTIMYFSKWKSQQANTTSASDKRWHSWRFSRQNKPFHGIYTYDQDVKQIQCIIKINEPVRNYYR